MQVVGVLYFFIMSIHLENGCCFGFVVFFIKFFWKCRLLMFFIMDYGNVFGKVGY